MKITAIKPQVKRSNRFSVFIDNKYSFSLSDASLIEAKLAPGMDIDEQKLKQLQQLGSEDLTYSKTLRYVAMRPRSQWEIGQYLKRHKVDDLEAKNIIDRLSLARLINDEEFAAAYIRDHQDLRHQSKRKIQAGLKQKRISSNIIDKLLNDESDNELEALKSTIQKKRRQSKYQDDLKLMQYLARQGFNYSDIKEALNTQD